MVDNDSQGNFQENEQQWICPDCETINTGEYCTVCGCPRPQKKQKDREQETVTEQGSYQEKVREWICPDCETHNNGLACVVCGCPRPELKEKKHISKKAVIAAVAAVVILISTLVGIAAWLPYHRYQKAHKLLESGQYEQAYQAFSAMLDSTLANLPTDEQSMKIRKQLCVQWAEEFRAAGQYSLALEALKPVSELDGIPSMIMEIRYSKAKWLLYDERNYEDAYQEFIALGSYQHSKLYASNTAEQWIQDTLEHADISQAERIRDTVTLSRSQGKDLYTKLYTTEIYDYSSGSGANCAHHINDPTVRGILLDMISPGPYVHHSELRILFAELDVRHPEELVRGRREILEELWYMPVVQNIVRNDLCVTEWLLGTWQAEKGGYHLDFYRTNSNEISCQYSLPWISSKETNYYGFQDLTLQVLEKEANSVWMDFYQFHLLEPDIIELFCAFDQKTYTLIRK